MGFFQKKEPAPEQPGPIIDQVVVERYEIRMNGETTMHWGDDSDYALTLYLRMIKNAPFDRFQLLKNGVVIRQNFPL